MFLKISTIFIVLIFFNLPLFSLPTINKSYNIPENNIEFTLSETVYSSSYIKERFCLGVAVLPFVSMWFTFDYLHNSISKKQSDIGDAFFKLIYYSNSYFSDRLQMAWLLQFRLPVAANAFSDSKWQNYAFGNNEIFIGPLLQLEVAKKISLHFHFLYVFRQGDNEDYYGGFNFNVANSKAWKRAFGFSPIQKENFFYRDRFFNDSVSFAFQVNTDILYPVIPAVGCYLSKRVATDKNFNYSTPIEGYAVDPLLISTLLIRYFFNSSTYAGFEYSRALYSLAGYPQQAFAVQAAALF